MSDVGLGLLLATSLAMAPAAYEEVAPAQTEVPVAPVPPPASQPAQPSPEPAPASVAPPMVAPPMEVPPMLEPVGPAAPPSAPPATAPVRPMYPPPPPRGSGAIIGGSLLTGLGSAVLLGTAISCAIVCADDREAGLIFGGVAIFGAATLGGGIGLQVSGFRRFDAAVQYDRRYGLQTTMAPRQLMAWTMLGGMFTSSFFGLAAGCITGSIYKRRYAEAYGPSRRFTWQAAPTWASRGPGLAFRGAF